jgi:Type I phosphodiesterase / nucleotide pyrophosphatase
VTEPSEKLRVDELRQQLRALGYLDAGVNRFVLGPATDRRRPSSIALLAALRVGVLTAILLGPAAAVGMNGRLPGLVTGPRDAVVIAVYLGLLFGGGVSIVTFVITLAVASLVNDGAVARARPLSRAAGAMVAIACLAYLTLWWRSANAGFGWNAPGWTAFALGVAVAISLLLGYVSASAAFAVGIARHGHEGTPDGTTPLPPHPSRSTWLPTIAAAVIAFAGAAALLVITAPREGNATERIPLAVVSSGLRVRVIAIDGVDPGVLDDVVASGRIPALARVLSGTRASLELDDSVVPRDPARAWTTVATGQPAPVHGVQGLETRRVAGLQGSVAADERSRLGTTIRAATDLLRLTRPSVASGNERRVKTLWEVAADAGLRTAVVNWWATWPASSPSDGAVILSDRAALRLEHGGALDAEIAPASTYERLRQRWPAIRTAAVSEARGASAGLQWSGSEMQAVLERSGELDAIQLTLLREVSTPAPDLAVVYLPGLDIAQTALLRPGDTALAPSEVAARLQALREYFVFLDRLLERVLTPADSELVFVVAEPGRVATSGAAMFGMTGPIANPNTSARGRTVDVAPTVLHALGIPVSQELAGATLSGLFNSEFVRRYPVRQVATYGLPSVQGQARSGQPLDQEMIDRLRSLGYVR